MRTTLTDVLHEVEDRALAQPSGLATQTGHEAVIAGCVTQAMVARRAADPGEWRHQLIATAAACTQAVAALDAAVEAGQLAAFTTAAPAAPARRAA